MTLTFLQISPGIIKKLCSEIIGIQPEKMSRQDRDQVVIQDENAELVQKPQSTAVNSFDHIVVSLRKEGADTI